MLRTFPIEFVRQTLEQKLYQEHLLDLNFFGGKNQMSLCSFYEQLKGQDDVDRFVETFRDLTDQQNRMGLIGNGVIVSPENPTYTNLYSALIIPLSFNCDIRCTLENRDQMIWTINNLIDKLKGRKVDIAQLDCVDDNGKHYAQPFVVGTLGQNDGVSAIKKGDYIGKIETITQQNSLTTQVNAILTQLNTDGVDTAHYGTDIYFYAEYQGKLRVITLYPASPAWVFTDNDGTRHDVIFPPEHTSFEKYKLSLSFDSIRCDEPRNLNSNEYCDVSFSGSATLVNASVQLGNDLLKISITKSKIVAETNVDFESMQNNPTWWLEPLEMPSGLNANTNPFQLASNLFKTNSHTDSYALTLQYTFVYDSSISFLRQLFNYARYGTYPNDTITYNDITPNIIYKVVEIWSSWGEYEPKEIKTKLVENVDVENTESDTLTLSLTMQIQGDNN